MGIVELLKEDYLFDDDESMSNVEPQQDDMSSPTGDETNIERSFIVRLVDYVDQKITLPAFATFDDAILNEVRKIMDETDNKLVLRTKQRIHNIVLDEKKKFLDRLQRRVGKLKVPKKK